MASSSRKRRAVLGAAALTAAIVTGQATTATAANTRTDIRVTTEQGVAIPQGPVNQAAPGPRAPRGSVTIPLFEKRPNKRLNGPAVIFMFGKNGPTMAAGKIESGRSYFWRDAGMVIPRRGRIVKVPNGAPVANYLNVQQAEIAVSWKDAKGALQTSAHKIELFRDQHPNGTFGVITTDFKSGKSSLYYVAPKGSDLVASDFVNPAFPITSIGAGGITGLTGPTRLIGL